MESLLNSIDRVLAELSYAPVFGSTAFVVSGWPWYGDAADWPLGVLESEVLASGKGRCRAAAADMRVAMRTEQARQRRAQQSEEAKQAIWALRRAQRADQPDEAKQAALAARREQYATQPRSAVQAASARRKEQRAARRCASLAHQRVEAAHVDVQQQVHDAECARVDSLLTEPSLDPSTWKAPRPDLASDVKDAYRFSQFMQEHLPLHVCAVCGVYHGAADVVRQSTHGLPMALLRRDGPQTDQLPRSGLTVCRIGGVDYCLAHEGVVGAAAPTFVLLEPAYKLVRAAVFDEQHVDLNVCKEHCLSFLQKNKVPRHSFVAFDAGRVPDVPNLVPLSPLEELIVSPLRVYPQ
jgi:hypothetical protein